MPHLTPPLHLSEEQLVAHYYRDADAAPDVAAHLAACADCRAQFETLRRVLALVDELPIPERGDHYGEQVWNRLRWRLDRRKRRTWVSALAAAAVLVLAFLLGRYASRSEAPAPKLTATNTIAPATASQPASQPGAPAAGANDRVLVFVVSDHLDSTGRMLMEVANADPGKSLDISAEQQRAGELVESNRIYRQTAAQRGDARIATLLSDIEPILIELSHAGAKLDKEQLASMQKRIESKGLLFKVRVMSAQAAQDEQPPSTTNSL
jgi:hypothetical protein